MENLAQKVKEQALQMGYEKCGIIKIEDVSDFAKKLKERMSRITLGYIQFSQFKGLANPAKQFPWAKSIIVLSASYANYITPEGFDGKYAKAYMFDSRLDENSKEWKMRQNFKAFLEAEGLKHESEPKFGITGLRWAAYKAGIGTIRHNNFFYTENSGSYCMLEAWLVDKELELKEETDSKPCSDDCGKCIGACPTNSLNRAYTMSLINCASFITTMSADKNMGNTSLKTAEKLGHLIYGCDICQDICPHNKGKHKETEDFPELSEIAQHMTPERIMSMSYEEIGCILSKYWYISQNNLWKWKLNALAFMLNNYNESHNEYIKLGLKDTDKRVRTFAKKTLNKLR